MQALLRKIRQILKDRRTRRFFTRVVSSVAAIVIFVTTYALILPAITLEKTAACGIEEHQHSDGCYEKRLVCGQEESDGHHHDNSCYSSATELTCKIPEHLHSAEKGCYDADGNLICELQEHVHDDSCYEEVRTLTCGQEEYKGHHHTDACYEKVLVCGKEVHTHSEKCFEESGSAGSAADTNSSGKPSESVSSEDADNTGDISSTGDAGDTGDNGDIMPGASDPNAAEEALPENDNYVPELEPLDMEVMLNSHTDLYYFHAEEGEKTPANSAEITDWKKVGEETTLTSTDLVKVYLAYTIPAGSLNETNPTARYRLPGNIHLTDGQIKAINKNENGITAGFKESDPEYQKYLGAEAIEGDRTPDELLSDSAQEYISAVVRAENVYDEKGLYGEKGAYLGQDLFFTFVPYSIEKNQNTYDADKALVSSGEKITGWFACDFKLNQIDWEQEDKNKEEDIIQEDTNVEENTGENSIGEEGIGQDDNDNNVEHTDSKGNTEKTAKVIFVQEDQKKEIEEISRVLRMDGEIDDGTSAETMTDEPEETGEDQDDHVFKAGTLSFEGDDYSITLDYSEDAWIPENASLSVREITAETDKEAYEAYLDQAGQRVATDDKTSVDQKASRFFDIEILVTETDSDGNEKTVKIEPAAPVSVNIQINEKPVSLESESVQSEPTVLHFAEEGVEQIDSTVTDDQNIDEVDQKTEIQFEAESFSVYGVVYTVDFHWEANGKEYDFSIPGGGFVSLEHLVEVLGIASSDENTENGVENAENDTENGNDFVGKVPGVDDSGENETTYEGAIKLNEAPVSEATRKFVADVESVEFSNPELVWVGEVDTDSTIGGLKEANGLKVKYSAELTEEQIREINSSTVEAGDWALISMHPFDTAESLIVTMSNGDIITVRVTDEAVSNVESGKSYVLYTVSNNGSGDVYRVLDIYGYSHDYTDPAQLEALGEEYLWTVSYSSNWIIRSKSTVRGDDGRDYYIYLDVNDGHNYQVNKVVKWLRSYSTDYPYVYLVNNNNSTFYIYGINYNNLALCWNNGFLIHNSGYAAAMRFYQQHPTYDYTVITANTSEGLVSGYSTQNGRQENNTDRIQSTTTTNKTNNTLITANPTSSRYLFSHWELDGHMVYANGTIVDDGSGATMGSRIDPGQLTFTSNNQVLKACFILNPDISSYVPAKSFDEQALQAWYDLLAGTNPPFASVDKTAEVYDYYNRIYQIDFTAASGVQTFASDIDLSFVMDVSNSMLFPATMNPYKNNGSVVTKKLTSSDLNSLPHGSGERYFVIGDEGYTSTVYTLWYNDGWRFADASQYAINRYAERNGGTVTEKEYELNSNNLNNNTNNRLNESDDFVIYTASSDYFSGFGDIYSKNNPAYNRLYYMKNAMETIVADAKDIAEEAARLGNASDNSNVRVAWEVFNRLHSNGADFKSVTDPTNGDTNFNAIVNALDNTQTSGGTRQDRGLDWAKSNFNYASASTTSTKRIAILITDGAPMITGTDAHHNDYTSSYEQSLGDYYAPTTGDGAWLRDQIRNKANALKAGADGQLGTNDDVTLITIGLGVDRVTNAPEWLEEVASALPSEMQVDGGASKFFYNVTDTAKLKYVLYDILQTFSAGAVVDTTVTDVIDDAFYPVNKLGEPLGVGDTYTDDNGVTGTIGQKEVTLGDGTQKTLWTVTWDHETVNWADHGGWHGSVLVKAKENFLGGNTINTNQESSVTANNFTADNSFDNFEPKIVPIESNKTFNPPTPYVNVNELKMESDSTSWTVYLGENVDPAEEILRMCEQVRVVEMVTQTRDDDEDDEPDHVYNSGIMLGHQTEGEAEKFLLKDIIGALTSDDIADLLEGTTVIKEYDKDVAQAYGHDVGTIYIELNEEIATDETGLDSSPHITTVTNVNNDDEPVELYTLTVWYMAGDPKNVDYHTGNYIGEGAGRVTNDVITECSHEINVFAKSLQIFKRNVDYNKVLTDAKFAIYRTWRTTDGDNKKVQLSGKTGDFFIEYPEVTVNSEGIATFANLPKLGENERRYLVETKAPEGYILLSEPLEITLNFDSSYRPVPPKADDGWTKEKVTDKTYDWEEKASLLLSNNMTHQANSSGQIDTSSIALDMEGGWSYYLVANNPGVELPATGGPGTTLIYLLGLTLTGLAGVGLLMKKRRRAA